MPSPSAPALYCTNKLYCFTANLSESETLAKMGCRVLRRHKLMLLTSFGGSKTRYDKDRLGGRRKPRHYKGLAGGGSRFGLGGACFVDDGGADEVAPLGPGAVVVANLVEAQQILEDEPGVRAALADAAVGDDFVFAVDALGFVKFLQVVVGLEGAVFVGGLRPRNIRGLWNVTGALGSFGHARRGDDLAGEFVDGANVNELPGFAAVDDRRDFFLAGTNGIVGAGDVIGRGGDVRGILCDGTLFLEPFLAAAVDEANVLMAIKLQLPEGVGGEPVVVVAIEKDGGVIGNAGGAEKLFESGLVDQVAADVVLELGLPVPADGAGDVALVVGSGVDVDFDEADVGGIEILSGPISGNENFRMFVVGHCFLLLRSA